MHFHFITHAKSLKTTSVILPAKVKRISNPIFTSDLDIGFLGVKRFLRSLVKLGFKISRSFLVKLEKEDFVIYRLCKIHHRLNLYSAFQHLNCLIICYNT